MKNLYVKLPNLNKIKDYEDFYKFITRNMKNPKKLKIDITSVYLTKQNETTLAEHLKKKMRRVGRAKLYSNKMYEKAWAMEWLCYSPNTSLQGLCKDGYALINNTKIFIKERKEK